VLNHAENKSAAAAEGAILLLVKLLKSSDADIQEKAVETLGYLVNGHSKVQAIPLIIQLAKSSDVWVQREAVETLGKLVFLHAENKSAAAFP
jgi:HEAT repeat protein